MPTSFDMMAIHMACSRSCQRRKEREREKKEREGEASELSSGWQVFQGRIGNERE